MITLIKKYIRLIIVFKAFNLRVLKFPWMAGIDVGHQFYSRAEMVAVGFHSHWLNGIDYMGQSYSKGVMHPFSLRTQTLNNENCSFLDYNSDIISLFVFCC